MKNAYANWIMPLLLLIWALLIMNISTELQFWLFAIISSIAAANFFSNLSAKLHGETNDDLIKKLFELSAKMIATMDATFAALNASQIKINELMFKYCPEEMTPKQIAHWKIHHKPSELQQKTINQILTPEITEKIYKELQAETEELVALDPSPGSEETKRLLFIAKKIEKYEESQKNPDN